MSQSLGDGDERPRPRRRDHQLVTRASGHRGLIQIGHECVAHGQSGRASDGVVGRVRDRAGDFGHGDPPRAVQQLPSPEGVYHRRCAPGGGRDPFGRRRVVPGRLDVHAEGPDRGRFDGYADPGEADPPLVDTLKLPRGSARRRRPRRP